MSKRLTGLVFLFSLVVSLIVIHKPQVLADELLDLENKLQETRQNLERSQKEKSSREQELEAAREIEKETAGSLNRLDWSLTSAKGKLNETLILLDNKEKEIAATVNFIKIKEQELNHQLELIAFQVRSYYTNSFVEPLNLFLASPDFADSSKLLIFREAIISNFKLRIEELNKKLRELAEQKQKLEEQKVKFEQEKAGLEKQKLSLEQQISSAQKELASAQSQQQILLQALAGLEHQIAQLTSQQKEILAAKAAAALATTTVGNVEITRQAIEKDPPRDGNLYFSFWTYGYPHRVGLNQYGAYGRSKAGQNSAQILKAYYSGVEIGVFPEMTTIKIGENGSEREILFEDDYLYGIAEMPSCWGKNEKGGMEALKAQAIAARTYAIAVTNNGQGSICTDQRCQVYTGQSKIQGECGEYWKKAVDETRGLVVLYQGQPVTAWYASTAGGFTLSSAEVWGSVRTHSQGIADFADPADLSSAYDGPKFGDSPWYHKAWGSEPWLSVAQVEDLFNAALLPEKYNNRIASVEKGGMSSNEVLEALKSESIILVAGLKSIEHFASATKSTTKLRAYFGDTFAEVDASRFRFVYNLRSPGTDAIWTSRFDLMTNK